MVVSKVAITNFRAHTELAIDKMGMVTVLVGRNNAGKSSVLHSIALPKYGFSEDAALPIGRIVEVLKEQARPAVIEISYEGVKAPLTLTIGPGSTWGIRWKDGATPPEGERASRGVYYLSPLRTPEREFRYDQLKRDVGIRGENAPNIFQQLKTDDDQKAAQIVEWLGKFGMNMSGMGAPTNRPGFGELRPITYGVRTNLTLTGAGLSAVLPVVVQGILCEKGETILVEEPESHLHRAAIEGLWAFFADCAKRGVQVICTTHSMEFLVAMHKAIETKVLQSPCSLVSIQRQSDGSSTAKQVDPSIFANIKRVIGTDLGVLG